MEPKADRVLLRTEVRRGDYIFVVLTVERDWFIEAANGYMPGIVSRVWVVDPETRLKLGSIIVERFDSVEHHYDLVRQLYENGYIAEEE